MTYNFYHYEIFRAKVGTWVVKFRLACSILGSRNILKKIHGEVKENIFDMSNMRN